MFGDTYDIANTIINYLKPSSSTKQTITQTALNELINEYTMNHRILSAAFPWIFVLGLSEHAFGTATVPKSLIKSWMLFYDKRCAEESHLLFLLFDQFKRHNNNKSCSYRIKLFKQGDERQKKFVKLVNDRRFLKDLKFAVKAPQSDTCKRIKAAIDPLIKITGRTMDWSVFERADTLPKVYALTHCFGIASHWITISPIMRNNILNLRLTMVGDNTYKEDYYELPNITTRSKWMIKNPIAATTIFYRMITKFFEIIVKLSVGTFTGKHAQYDDLIEQEYTNVCGAFGSIRAYIGVYEQQQGGSLHLHALLFGSWSVKIFQKWVHDPQARKLLIDLIDSHITCKIPESIVNNTCTPQIRRILKKEISDTKILKTIMEFLKPKLIHRTFPDCNNFEIETEYNWPEDDFKN